MISQHSPDRDGRVAVDVEIDASASVIGAPVRENVEATADERYIAGTSLFSDTNLEGWLSSKS